MRDISSTRQLPVFAAIAAAAVLCPGPAGCRGTSPECASSVAALEARLKELSGPAQRRQPFDVGRANPDDGEQQRWQSLAAVSLEWTRGEYTGTLELAPSGLATFAGRSFYLHVDQDRENLCAEITRSSDHQIEIQQHRGLAEPTGATLMAHADTPATMAIDLLDLAASCGLDRIDLAFRDADPPGFTPETVPDHLADAFEQYQTLVREGRNATTHYNAIRQEVFRGCDVDETLGVAAVSGRDKPLIWRIGVVQDYEACGCKVDADAIAWLYQQEFVPTTSSLALPLTARQANRTRTGPRAAVDITWIVGPGETWQQLAARIPRDLSGPLASGSATGWIVDPASAPSPPADPLPEDELRARWAPMLEEGRPFQLFFVGSNEPTPAGEPSRTQDAGTPQRGWLVEGTRGEQD
jgi:hypothetical protein